MIHDLIEEDAIFRKKKTMCRIESLSVGGHRQDSPPRKICTKTEKRKRKRDNMFSGKFFSYHFVNIFFLSYSDMSFFPSSPLIDCSSAAERSDDAVSHLVMSILS